VFSCNFFSESQEIQFDRFDRHRLEFSLVLNKLHGTPVLPIFVAELTGVGNNGPEFSEFKFGVDFPDVPHVRDEGAQEMLDKLSETIRPEDKKFLKSIKKTMSEIFKLQGVFLKQRGENQDDINSLVDTLLKLRFEDIPRDPPTTTTPSAGPAGSPSHVTVPAPQVLVPSPQVPIPAPAPQVSVPTPVPQGPIPASSPQVPVPSPQVPIPVPQAPTPALQVLSPKIISSQASGVIPFLQRKIISFSLV